MNKQAQLNITYALGMLSYRCTVFISKVCELNSGDYKLRKGTTCFGNIPYSYIEILAKELEIIQRRLYKKLRRKPKFLDIGCGIGNLVMLASFLDYEAAGLEYNLKTYRVAKKLCNITLPDSKIIKGDMRTFKHYSEYDVLYCYQPIADYKKMDEFTIKLAEEMKSGAYVICVGTGHGFVHSKKFKSISSRCAVCRKK
jgi:2-polyprenyl-3-methyl-5-hydroxy-6-metoxy-1,4-benzoquinol methylase